MGVCVETIKRWEKAGVIQPIKVGGRVLIPAEQLEALVRTKQGGTEAE
jgi:excisionase family DNA binding protein